MLFVLSPLSLFCFVFLRLVSAGRHLEDIPALQDDIVRELLAVCQFQIMLVHVSSAIFDAPPDSLLLSSPPSLISVEIHLYRQYLYVCVCVCVCVCLRYPS